MDGAHSVAWPASFPGAGPLSRWATHRLKSAALARAVASFRPSVILASEPDSLRAAVNIRRSTGARLIYDAHEYYEDEKPGDRARGLWARREHMRFAAALDGFVTVNESIARLYAASQPTFPPAVVVMNAAPTLPPPVYDGRLHDAAGLTRGERILMAYGGLEAHRGLEVLVRAGELLPDSWSLVLMGDGSCRQQLTAQAGARTRWLPPVPHHDLPLWLCGAELGTILYERGSLNQLYATPNKLWELAAAGVPTLITNLPEVIRLTNPYHFCRIVDYPLTPRRVADAISTWRELDRRAARTTALRFAIDHSWETEVRKLVDLVGRLAGRKSF